MNWARGCQTNGRGPLWAAAACQPSSEGALAAFAPHRMPSTEQSQHSLTKMARSAASPQDAAPKRDASPQRSSAPRKSQLGAVLFTRVLEPAGRRQPRPALDRALPRGPRSKCPSQIVGEGKGRLPKALVTLSRESSSALTNVRGEGAVFQRVSIPSARAKRPILQS